MKKILNKINLIAIIIITIFATVACSNNKSKNDDEKLEDIIKGKKEPFFTQEEKNIIIDYINDPDNYLFGDEKFDIPIIFEDNNILVVNKPENLSVIEDSSHSYFYITKQIRKKYYALS